MPESCPDTNTLPSRIANLVHTHFDGLPKRSKPVLRDDGTAEWIPMTGIVLVKGRLHAFISRHFETENFEGSVNLVLRLGGARPA